MSREMPPNVVKKRRNESKEIAASVPDRFQKQESRLTSETQPKQHYRKGIRCNRETSEKVTTRRGRRKESTHHARSSFLTGHRHASEAPCLKIFADRSKPMEHAFSAVYFPLWVKMIGLS